MKNLKYLLTIVIIISAYLVWNHMHSVPKGFSEQAENSVDSSIVVNEDNSSQNPEESVSGTEQEENGSIQVINSTLTGGRYPDINVKAGIPVRWVIDAPPGSLNGCNYRMIIQPYGIERGLDIGENVIEFTPEEAGVFNYSCWMGMVRGTITVMD